MIEKFKKILKTPTAAILAAKKEKNLRSTINILVIEWVLVAIGMAIIPTQLGGLIAYGGLTLAAFAFLMGIIATLFIACLLQITITTLGGKGEYFEALTSLTYGIFALSLGFLISAILSLIPIVGGAIGFVVIAICGVLSFATLYRAIKELFTVDLITVWIGIGMMVGVLILAFYIAILLYAAGSLPLLQALISGYSGLQTGLPTV